MRGGVEIAPTQILQEHAATVKQHTISRYSAGSRCQNTPKRRRVSGNRVKPGRQSSRRTRIRLSLESLSCWPRRVL